MMLIGAMFLQAGMQKMVSDEYGEQMPGRERVLASLTTMLVPPAVQPEAAS